MRRTVFAAVFGISLLLGVQALAQDAPVGSAVLDSWVGDWTFEGTYAGIPTTGTLSWEWILDGHYMVGEQAQTMTMPDGSQVTLEGVLVFISEAGGTYQAYSLNDRGEHYPMTGQDSEGGGVTLSWTDGMGTHQLEVGPAADTVVATHMMQDESGNFAEVGGITYTRQ